jgi:hypothetical protein
MDLLIYPNVKWLSLLESHMAVVTESPAEKKKSFVGKMMPNVELHLPVKGVLLGVGAALGQGFGIVLSKVGMNYYAISAEGTSVVEYIPFAATHMRIISGAIDLLHLLYQELEILTVSKPMVSMVEVITT